MSHLDEEPPLAGVRVLERARGVAAAYAGRLLTILGAETIMLEDAGGSPLRREPPFLDAAGGVSSIFAYLAAGKRSLACDLREESGRNRLYERLGEADILIDDTPLAERVVQGLQAEDIRSRYPGLVHVSVLPFGAHGDKANWQAEEVNLIHSAGEGYLLPNGLSNSLFPERPPLKIYGHFASYQGGVVAAMSALAALFARDECGGQFVDVSIQDAALIVGAFAIQRLGDGSLEHRSTRSFRYGGVFETKDGYVELLMLEDHQWTSFVELMGNPDWAVDARFSDPLERSRCGDEINEHIRRWIRTQTSSSLVERAQAAGVPLGKYRKPAEILHGEHERARELFEPLKIAEGVTAEVLVAPFRFERTPLHLRGGIPELDELAGDRFPAPPLVSSGAHR